jgi:hypothetical protein
MGTLRFFSGGRDSSGKQSIASEIMRLEFSKKGKLPAAERFKIILKRKMDENRKQLPQNGRQLSQRAQNALKEMAAKKAAKEAKKLRRMVIVAPRNFHNGRITAKGKIIDIEGNMIGQVNTKNAKMATNSGWTFGKYKAKSRRTEGSIIGAIDKYSPYYINLRKLQALQMAGVDPVTGRPLGGDTINVHGSSGSGGYVSEPAFSSYGESAGGPRQNVGVTAWGAMSDNVWGTFSDNAWGRSLDNVWGTTSSDIWGGVGGSPFGGKGVKIFGTGNGKNYIKAITNFLAALLGMKNKKTVDAFKAARRTKGVGSSGPRAGGGATRGPVIRGGRR